MDENTRVKYRNDWIAARMYAIDIQYTAYESALTRERQSVSFGAAATTLGLTTASGLIAPVATKNLLTGLAGFVTGTRAAYDNDILLAHSVQWIQSQMQATRATVYNRILTGMRLSTTAYPLAAALSDLEAYYRAGTFTGGLLATSQVVAGDAQAAEDDKANIVEVKFSPTTNLGARIEAFARSTPENRALVSEWLTAKGGGVPRFIFIRKGDPALQAQLIRELSIP
jgi:hypothetical protein